MRMHPTLDNTASNVVPSGTARVLIVDDHELVREGFVELVEAEPGLQVVAQAASGRQAIEMVKQHQPAVALIDFSLPDMSGLDVIRGIRAVDPGVRMLVVSMHEESVYAERVIDAGAMGYVNKEDCIQTLAAAIRCVLRGELHLSARLAERLKQRSRPQWTPGPGAPPARPL